MKSGARLKLVGVNQNRIYKLAQKNGILLKNVEKLDYKTLLFDVSYNKIKNMIAICEKNNYNLTIVKRYGFLLLFTFLKQKLGIFLGCLALIALSIFSTNFIWRVKVYGAQGNSLKQVMQILNENNVKVFSLKRDNLILNVKQKILGNVKGVSQVSIMVKGTTVLINIKQSTLKEDVLGAN